MPICDRLIEDTTRRFKGEFFTPTEWVDEAHRMIENEFGEDWKDKYVVWDPACGTGNLTRDYKFKELYCSTLNKSDLDIMDQMNYNPEAIKFQFDFLNDSDDKFPDGLKKVLEEKKPIIVFMNPPYGTATEFGTKSKAEVSKNHINTEMLKNGLGNSAQQLYAQFLYRIAELQDNHINIMLFSPPLFMTGGAFKQFRKYFTDKFKFRSGYLIDANNFADVKSWGLNFTIWSPGQYNGSFIVKAMRLDEHRVPGTVSKKVLYNTDLCEPASVWVRKLIVKHKAVKSLCLSSPIKPKYTGDIVGRLVPDSIGFMNSAGNNVQFNGILVGIYSTAFANGHGFSIMYNNFKETISLFTARKTIISTWINQKDEYLAPNTEHSDYEQWNNDCLIYSLFNNSSNQSSLRDITYKDKQWDIINEWFWCPKEHIQNLAEEYKINEIEQDIKNFGRERFVCNKLKETPLSEDAKNVLNKAVLLVTDSFKYRKIMIEEYPEYHLNTWDAGWYQIKKILKKYMPDELKAFRILYKEFENRMREGVYKFGFLKE